MTMVLRYGGQVLDKIMICLHIYMAEKVMPNLPLDHILIISPAKSQRKRRRLAVRLCAVLLSSAMIIGWVIVDKSI